jgi:ornithine carbamoyltransferase
MKGNDFLSIRDFSPQEILCLLILARQIKTHPTTYSEALKRETLALIFEKPSLRTRVTFDVGIQQLGGFSVYLSPAEINLGKRESIYDVAKNLERMVQGIMIRTFAHEIVEQLAEYANIPVINGLTDYSHPCQAMADYLTIWEAKGNREGLKLAFVGAGNNGAHSLMFAGAQLGVEVSVATPHGYEPKADAVKWARQRGRETGASCTITNDAEEAVAGADVVYTPKGSDHAAAQLVVTRVAILRLLAVDYENDPTGSRRELADPRGREGHHRRAAGERSPDRSADCRPVRGRTPGRPHTWEWAAGGRGAVTFRTRRERGSRPAPRRVRCLHTR